MKEIFDKYVETSFEDQNQAKFKFKQFEVNYKAFFPEAKKDRVLDIGVGRGEMLTCMRDWGYDYQGVDISPSTIQLCKALNLNCEVTSKTEDWLSSKIEEFSLITCLDVLEHVPRDQTIAFLTAIRGSLKVDGKVIIQVPNLQSPFGYLHHFNDFTHVSGFVEHSLSQVLLTAGFKRFEMHGFEEIIGSGLKIKIRLMLRYFYHGVIRFLRKVNVNPNPRILDPVLFVVASK